MIDEWVIQAVFSTLSPSGTLSLARTLALIRSHWQPPTSSDDIDDFTLRLFNFFLNAQIVTECHLYGTRELLSNSVELRRNIKS
jgi:hypothetical protein